MLRLCFLFLLFLHSGVRLIDLFRFFFVKLFSTTKVLHSSLCFNFEAHSFTKKQLVFVCFYLIYFTTIFNIFEFDCSKGLASEIEK